MPPNMCPKTSKNKTKANEVMKNKQNVINQSDKAKVTVRKKTKGEIKHDKKMMKKKAKSMAESGNDNELKCETVEFRRHQREMCQASDRSSNEDNNEPGENEDGRGGNDLDVSSEVESAFVKSIIEKTGLKLGRDKEDDSRPIKLSFTEEELQNDYLNGFRNVKKGKIAKAGVNKTSEGFGFEAYKYIIEGRNDKGTEFLTRALVLDHFDVRHYFNRSYSQLCTGDYEEALTDIHFVMNHNEDTTILARLKCRQGQIFKRMEQFEKAEECFKDCLNLFPNSMTVRCEFLRMKISQLQSMGFPETDIINLLYDNPYLTLREAITFLTELARYQYLQGSPEDSVSISENEEYESDTEENPCNTRLFIEMTNFNTYTKDNLWYRENNENKNTPSSPEGKVIPGGHSGVQSSQQIQTNSPPAVKELRVINASGTKKTVLKAPPGTNVNNRAVWVGSLTTAITESVLKRAFSVFGPVASVYRAPDSACAFVNFENVLSTDLALAAESVEVNGKALPIRLNKRTR
ncbi:uncharacterized protein LOC107045245 [Diachasma alloeum]|uniref:uncharacterized protein LOC107045245 n=1 Tax=Diachasma alloeum TaxID=454923 RepID=UPI00073833C0|nr:uncharacterized protein LOC107045245 [Diachasma alloeum]